MELENRARISYVDFVEEREDWLDQGHGSCLLREPQMRLKLS